MMQFLKFIILISLVFACNISCKKDKVITDPSAKLEFSQDSVLFDTVFTTIGSSTQNIRVRNKNDQKIKISSIVLQGGAQSAFIINVDGSPGHNFKDIEIAAKDSLYIFIQVNVNPTNQNSPLIITDKLIFTVNGNSQELPLEAWGQDAYYHYPTDAIKFQDGSYFPYSTIGPPETGTFVTWPNDKPHVIYGYLVVDSAQTLIVNAGTRIYMNYKAGLWVFRKGELQILGQKGNEVIVQGARREADYADEPGQWDRIWINEGSLNNVIDYAIIKNGYIGVQAELFASDFSNVVNPRRLKITNTRIQNMSLWGLYAVAFNIYGGNNVISNCQEHSVNLILGGKYTFLHCTFSNFWNKGKTRELSTLKVNNYYEQTVLPLDSCYFGNCIIDGSLENELIVDVKNGSTFTVNPFFSSCWIRSNADLSDVSRYLEVKKGDSPLEYEDPASYNFETKAEENRIKGFTHAKSIADAGKFLLDIKGNSRSAAISSGSITAGAYQK